MKIAIFHDCIGAIGGGEKLVLTLARGLEADVITTDVDEDSVKKMGFDDVRIISLGGTIKLPPLKQISASLRFELCDFSKAYDFFIFSGNWAHYAAKRHKPNLWYCHTPVRAFYDLYDVFLERQSFLNSLLFRFWVKLYKRLYEYYGDFWLSVNRLYLEKRVELQIEAFRQLPEERLLIVGGYAEADHASVYATSLQKNCQIM